MDDPGRQPEALVDPQFLDRWSPRAFSPEPLTEEEVHSLFEAARWAPSAGNLQPWLFLCALSKPDLDLFRGLLDAGNQRWATAAPALFFVLARRARPSGRPNETAKFDAGAAWMSLALQARKLGLYAHAMAGFDHPLAYTVLGVPEEEYEIIAAVAVGHHDDPEKLPPDLQEREKPSQRKPLNSVFRLGRFRSEVDEGAA